jgi:hypothetical protein
MQRCERVVSVVSAGYGRHAGREGAKSRGNCRTTFLVQMCLPIPARTCLGKRFSCCVQCRNFPRRAVCIGCCTNHDCLLCGGWSVSGRICGWQGAAARPPIQICAPFPSLSTAPAHIDSEAIDMHLYLFVCWFLCCVCFVLPCGNMWVSLLFVLVLRGPAKRLPSSLQTSSNRRLFRYNSAQQASS